MLQFGDHTYLKKSILPSRAFSSHTFRTLPTLIVPWNKTSPFILNRKCPEYRQMETKMAKLQWFSLSMIAVIASCLNADHCHSSNHAERLEHIGVDDGFHATLRDKENTQDNVRQRRQATSYKRWYENQDCPRPCPLSIYSIYNSLYCLPPNRNKINKRIRSNHNILCEDDFSITSSFSSKRIIIIIIKLVDWRPEVRLTGTFWRFSHSLKLRYLKSSLSCLI